MTGAALRAAALSEELATLSERRAELQRELARAIKRARFLALRVALADSPCAPGTLPGRSRGMSMTLRIVPGSSLGAL